MTKLTDFASYAPVQMQAVLVGDRGRVVLRSRQDNVAYSRSLGNQLDLKEGDKVYVFRRATKDGGSEVVIERAERIVLDEDKE